MLIFDEIIKIIKSYNKCANFDLIKRAYIYSSKVHSGQKRKNGQPYLSHPLEVAKILTQLRLDDASICTGLLHDTIEDTLTSKMDLEVLFNSDIAELVDGVTKLSQIKIESVEERQAENFRKMLVAMSNDIRVLLVKLADRLHNMRTLQFMRSGKQEQIALETMEIYAPLANRLGMGWLKIELEDLSFQYLKVKDFKLLKKKIGESRKEQGNFIDRISKDLHESLFNAKIENFKILGRPKHLWSIYRKMKEKDLDFEDIHDLIAFRILVASLNQCYVVLGRIHSLWKPIPGRFKDYIAIPKPNGYRSLHTTLFGPNGRRIEIQIRSLDMHKIAESGIAAHWEYKENINHNKARYVSKYGFIWLRQLMDWQKTLKDPNEFLDSVKLDLFSEEVYVFTPHGKIIELPRGATPIDFAFAIHSKLGIECSMAKVNSRFVSLEYILKNGDTCSIISNKKLSYKKKWLTIVKTSKARTKIRALLRDQEREQSKKIGKELLKIELMKYSINLSKLLRLNNFKDLLKNNNYKTIDDAFISLGYGKIDVKSIIKFFLPCDMNKKINNYSIFEWIFKRFFKQTSLGIKIEGIDNLFVNYPNCCTALKGDPIIGYIALNRALSIHRKNCNKVMELDPKRRINVSWDLDAKFMRTIFIQVFTNDREGMLRDLSFIFFKLNINISEAKCSVLANKNAVNMFKCNIIDLKQLNIIIKELESVKGVHYAKRLRSVY